MKLEVGDIKMDSESGIQIGAVRHSNSQSSQVAHSTFTHLPPERVDEPISKSVLGAMVVMALVALAAMLLLVAGHPLAAALLFFGFQLPTGWFVLTTRAKAAADQKLRAEHELFAQDAQRLLETFAETSSPKSISRIQEELSLTEDRTLQLVSTMLQANTLEEDVDIESGRFVYRPSTEFNIDPDQLSATDRLTQTQSQRAIAKERS